MSERSFLSAPCDIDGRPLLSLTVRDGTGHTVILACGEVDIATASLLLECGIQALRAEPERLVLDLAQVTFFSAAGVRALLALSRAAGDGTLRLRAPSASVCFVLELASLARAFPVEQPDE